MENFGILLSIPAAFVASSIYRLLLLKATVRYPSIAPIIKPASILVLVLFAVEIVLLVTIGAVRSRALIGPAFEIAILGIFILGMPALANVLVLRNREGILARWYTVVPLCTVFAAVLVFLLYCVSDQLYGKFGQGPYHSR
jgi:hypothetical protein